jgi:hypothetical protein
MTSGSPACQIVACLQIAVLAVDIAERRWLQNDGLNPGFRGVHDMLSFALLRSFLSATA